MTNKTFNIELLYSDFGKLKQIIQNKAPFSKVLLIALQEDFISKGCKIVDMLKSVGHKVITVLFNSNFEFSVESVCGLFTSPEDVRIIFSLSDKLSSVTRYFAQIKKIPAVIVSDRWKSFLFANKVFIKNGKNLDRFYCSAETFILLGKPFLDVKDAYAYACAEKFNLLDLFITHTYSSVSFDKTLFEQYKSALNDFENVLFSDNLDEYKNQYFLSVIKKGVDFYSSVSPSTCTVLQVFNFFSALDNVSKLIMVKHVLNYAYKTLTERERKVFDYNSHAVEIARLTGFNQVSIMENFIFQIKNITAPNGRLQFKELIMKGNDFFNQAVATAKSLGVEKMRLSAKHARVLKICGDTPLGINLLSVLREIN